MTYSHWLSHCYTKDYNMFSMIKYFYLFNVFSMNHGKRNRIYQSEQATSRIGCTVRYQNKTKFCNRESNPKKIVELWQVFVLIV